jgi:hypothetical protein
MQLNMLSFRGFKPWHFTFQIGAHFEIRLRILKYISLLADAFPWRISTMAYLFSYTPWSIKVWNPLLENIVRFQSFKKHNNYQVLYNTEVRIIHDCNNHSIWILVNVQPNDFFNPIWLQTASQRSSWQLTFIISKILATLQMYFWMPKWPSKNV